MGMGRFPGSTRPRFCGVGNAPCAPWGTLEFEGLGGEQVPWDRMMDELAETGYTGMELGDWGYLPSEAGALRRELDRRGLTMLGAVEAVLEDKPTPVSGPDGRQPVVMARAARKSHDERRPVRLAEVDR